MNNSNNPQPHVNPTTAGTKHFVPAHLLPWSAVLIGGALGSALLARRAASRAAEHAQPDARASEMGELTEEASGEAEQPEGAQPNIEPRNTLQTLKALRAKAQTLASEARGRSVPAWRSVKTKLTPALESVKTQLAPTYDELNARLRARIEESRTSPADSLAQLVRARQIARPQDGETEENG